MGDQIKLRAWLPGIGKMTYAHTLDEWIKMGPTPINDAGEGLVWLRWTGLKDKNGTEIYEGDIMRGYNAFGEAFAQLTVIEYNVNEACWHGADWYDLAGEEVIANIHQHPELLKETGHEPPELDK